MYAVCPAKQIPSCQYIFILNTKCQESWENVQLKSGIYFASHPVYLNVYDNSTVGPYNDHWLAY